MAFSMTGFGRNNTSKDSKFGFNVEIRTLNSKFLEIDIKIPKDFYDIESKVRNIISENFKRGKIQVYISLSENSSIKPLMKLNESRSDNFFEILSQIKERYKIKEEISLSHLLKNVDIFSSETEEMNMDSVFEEIKTGIIEASNLCNSMREFEGNKLKEDVLEKCKLIKTYNDKIKEDACMITTKLEEKIRNRVLEVLKNSEIDENRIIQEVAIYADKFTIDEEIVRINSHIDQIEDTFKNQNNTIGRKLDFILQELNREVNTISSKSQDINTINLAIEMKHVIEKIREQIQNLE